MVANPANLIRFPDSKDVVDNQPNESRTIRANQNLSATAPVSPNLNTISSTTNQTNISTQMSTATELLRFEEQRLKTFERWPHSFISSRTLAKTGFYYIGPHDQVRCYFCKVEVSRWESGDNEVNEHNRWSPNCPLLKRRDTSNVPLEPGKINSPIYSFQEFRPTRLNLSFVQYLCCGLSPALVSELEELLPPLTFDVCGPCGIDVRPGSYTETQFTSSTSAEAEEPTANNHQTPEHETQTLKHPDFPEYAIETARLRSFDEWPKTMKQRPKQLSDAGFFYTQKSDRVICFSCGGGLRDWDEQDDPWEQHALWYSKCDYLRLVKGQEFVDAVKAKYAKLDGEKSNGGMSSSSQESVASSCGSSGSSSNASTPINTPCDKDDQNQDNRLCESRLCKICYSSEYNTAFFPCGHVIACTKCASSVTKCPLCRKPFERVMRVFFS